MNSFIKPFILFTVLISPLAKASVIVDGTRYVFNGDKTEAALAVENKDKNVNLVQSWVEPADKDIIPDAFVITPPLFRLSAGERNTLRIIRVSQRLPADRESLYWLNIKGIPASKKGAQESSVQLAVNTRIKLIYRPESLLGQSSDAFKDKITWRIDGNTLIAKNPSPYYINFYSIRVGNTKVSPMNYIAPFGERIFILPAGQKSDTISWAIINDYGVAGAESHTK
ncbi:fimbria/pilus periplasmic chaperone [Buttiauxella noackiae]|uniref:fimbria/pilus periplasmic chaperone n=1 Tax=Buttiauxella noackiae TaxID=82992 RepID=UPI0035A727DB